MASHDDASGSDNEPNAAPPEKIAAQTPVVSADELKPESKSEPSHEATSGATSAALSAALSAAKKSRRGVPRNATQVPTRSKKLNSTLKELESAFTGWESLNCSGKDTNDTSDEEERLKASLAKEAAATNEEFRKKTKKLLSQLREQLAELGD